MTPRWERIVAPQPEGAAGRGPLLMDATLTPNRSLSRQAFFLVIGAFAFANAIMATFFLLHGAYPVSGFMGLDVLGLLWAFHVSYRSGRAVERVRVSPAAIEVSREAPDVEAAHWTASPMWARVQDHPRAVRIAAGATSLMVGSFLSPAERDEFAAALSAALARARVQRPSTSRIE
jgi:uncharacterized membrane protein